MEVSLERTPKTIKGYYLKKLKDNFGKEKTFIYNKEQGIIQIRNVEETFESFVPVVFENVEHCVNTETMGEWLECGANTKVTAVGPAQLEEIARDVMNFDVIEKQGYYLVSGNIKYVNASPLFDPKNFGERPREMKPIYEQSKLNIKLTIVDRNNKQLNLTVNKLSHLINAYPMQVEKEFLDWFEAATDDERLDELKRALPGTPIIVLGRGSKFIERKDEETPQELKRPFLIVGEDGFIVNLDRLGIDINIPMIEPDNTDSSTMPQVSTTTSTTTPTTTLKAFDIVTEVMNYIRAGKGTKYELTTELPTKLGLGDAQPIIYAIKELSAKGKIYREGSGENSIFKTTEPKPDIFS